MNTVQPGDQAVRDLYAALHLDDRTRDLAFSMVDVQNAVHEWWRVVYLPWFTDHGPNHSRRVAEYALRFADIPSLRADLQLTSLEKYVLFTAAWLHDVGMQDTTMCAHALGELTASDFQRIRHEHPDRTKELLLGGQDLFGIPPSDPALREVIAFVARGHGTRYYQDSIAVLQNLTHVRNLPIRGPLLTALLLLADELDLHYERAVPLPAKPLLGAVSEAHSFKHGCVTAADPTVAADGTLGAAMVLTFPPQVNNQVQLDVERWITSKLRRQMGMVEPQITEGFARQARLNRSIAVRYNVPHVARASISTEAATVIENELALEDLLDHMDQLRDVLSAVAFTDVVVVAGRWDSDRERDIDGREDLVTATSATLALGGAAVHGSVRLRLTGAGSLSDVLSEWLSSLIGDSEEAELEATSVCEREEVKLARLLGMLVTELQPLSDKQMVLSLRNMDGLSPGDLTRLGQTIIPSLLAATAGSLRFLISAQTSQLITTATVTTVQSQELNASEIGAHLRRYVEQEAASGAAAAHLDYDAYRSMCQGYETTLRVRSRI